MNTGLSTSKKILGEIRDIRRSRKPHVRKAHSDSSLDVFQVICARPSQRKVRTGCFGEICLGICQYENLRDILFPSNEITQGSSAQQPRVLEEETQGQHVSRSRGEKNTTEGRIGGVPTLGARNVRQEREMVAGIFSALCDQNGGGRWA